MGLRDSIKEFNASKRAEEEKKAAAQREEIEKGRKFNTTIDGIVNNQLIPYVEGVVELLNDEGMKAEIPRHDKRPIADNLTAIEVSHDDVDYRFSFLKNNDEQELYMKTSATSSNTNKLSLKNRKGFPTIRFDPYSISQEDIENAITKMMFE